jgi:hypothetical protein
MKKIHANTYPWAAVAVALLAGCATEAELAAQKQGEVDAMVRIYGPACERLGYQRDTDPWRDCILRLSTRESLDRRNFPATFNCFGPAGFGFTQCTAF